MNVVFYALLLWHILSAVTWLGALLVANFLILPVLQKVSPQSRSELGTELTPRLFRYGLGAGVGTVLSGTLLFFYLDFPTGFPGLPYIQAGALLALVILVIGTAVGRNTATKMAGLTKQLMSQGTQGDPAAMDNLRLSIGRLQTRLRVNGLVNTFLLALVLALMVAGTTI